MDESEVARFQSRLPRLTVGCLRTVALRPLPRRCRVERQRERPTAARRSDTRSPSRVAQSGAEIILSHEKRCCRDAPEAARRLERASGHSGVRFERAAVHSNTVLLPG